MCKRRKRDDVEEEEKKERQFGDEWELRGREATFVIQKKGRNNTK